MFKHTLISAAVIGAALSGQAFAQNDEVASKQQAEINELKAQLKQTEQKLESLATALESGSANASANALSGVSIGGYGEHHFNHYFTDGKDDQVDAHRYVLYIGKEFTESVRFVSEFELEHSLAGDGAPGEVELEQAYIEWDFAQQHKAQAGLFLVPVGILNETHEPDTFYGVERNNVEKNIIPTTWWETGAQVLGELAPGVSYNFAVHSGLHLEEAAKIRGGRQKSAKAVANDWAATGRIKYTAVAGLELAASLQYQNDLKQNKADTDMESAATLLETHAVYQTGDLTVKALYARWDIDGDDFKAEGLDEQSGYFVEAGYKLTPEVGVFARHSSWDNEAGNSADTEVSYNEIGVNYWLHPKVVFKADIGKQSKAGDDSSVLNLGVGWSF